MSAPWWPVPADADEENRVWLQWLVRLRWVALFAQLVTVSLTYRILDGAEVVGILFGVMLVLALSNAWAIGRLARREPIEQRSLLLHLATEVLALTAFFLLAGGWNNPFVPLYLVHVAMGSVVLTRSGAAFIAALSIGCFAALHAWHLPLHLSRHSIPEGVLRTSGQLIAFGITTVSVAAFIVGVSETLRHRKQQLLEARDRTARIDRLRSVGTLAAGAAHELNTPLSTIRLRLMRIARRHDDDATAADTGAIRGELDRCTQIVDQLLVGAGDPAASEMVRRPLRELVDEIVHLWAKGSPVGVVLDMRDDDVEVEVPSVAFAQGLTNLLENARQAQAEAGTSAPLEVRVAREDGRGVVAVRDHGCGLPDHPDRIGEPFYTTKPTGTGLGVFVARNVADGVGGGLSYQEKKGQWTEARWWFPEAPRRSA